MSRENLSLSDAVLALLLLTASVSAPALGTGNGHPSIAFEEQSFTDALNRLSQEMGFAVELAPSFQEGARTVTLSGPTDRVLSQLLRDTNHVLVKDGDRVVRVLILSGGGESPITPDATEQAEATEQASTSMDTASLAATNVFIEERALVAEGRAPDSGEATALTRALTHAATVAEEERRTAWQGFGAPTSSRP